MDSNVERETLSSAVMKTTSATKSNLFSHGKTLTSNKWRQVYRTLLTDHWHQMYISASYQPAHTQLALVRLICQQYFVMGGLPHNAGAGNEFWDNTRFRTLNIARSVRPFVTLSEAQSVPGLICCLVLTHNHTSIIVPLPLGTTAQWNLLFILRCRSSRGGCAPLAPLEVAKLPRRAVPPLRCASAARAAPLAELSPLYMFSREHSSKSQAPSKSSTFTSSSLRSPCNRSSGRHESKRRRV